MSLGFSDITYIWTNEGWLYLAGVKDHTLKSWLAMPLINAMTADLVCIALNIAIKNKQPSKRLIVHSDRAVSIAAMPTTRLSNSISLQAR